MTFLFYDISFGSNILIVIMMLFDFIKEIAGSGLGSNPQMPPPDIAMLQHKNISNFDGYHLDHDVDDDHDDHEHGQ